MFSSIFNVLVTIIDDGSNSEQKYEAKILRNSIQSFDFVFYKHLMKAILGITNDLSQSQTLQRKDQDIVNAMSLDEVSSFCNKHDILMLKMNDVFLV